MEVLNEVSRADNLGGSDLPYSQSLTERQTKSWKKILASKLATIDSESVLSARSFWINAMFTANRRLKCGDRSLFLAIAYLDKCIYGDMHMLPLLSPLKRAFHPLSKTSEYSLAAAVVILRTAACVECDDAPSMIEVGSMFTGRPSKAFFVAIQRDLLRFLKFSLLVPTAIDFIEAFASWKLHNPSHEIVYRCSIFTALVGLLGAKVHTKHYPSDIGLASITTAWETVTKGEALPFYVERTDELTICECAIRVCLHQKIPDYLQMVHKESIKGPWDILCTIEAVLLNNQAPASPPTLFPKRKSPYSIDLPSKREALREYKKRKEVIECN